MSDSGQFPSFKHEHGYEEMLTMFDDLSFVQRMRRMFRGLSAPPESGEYKFAILQLQRLSAPFLAVVVPMAIIGLLMVFGDSEQMGQQVTATEIITPESIDDLDEPPPPPEDMDIVDPVDVEFTVDVDMPSTVAPVDNQPMSPQPAAFDSVSIVKSPIVMRGIYGSRTPGARGQAIMQYGGSAAGETAVMRALRWLVKNQLKDGSWGKNKSAMTGLALLAFLAHGETPASEEFGSAVERGIRFLVDSQQPNGLFKVKDGNNYSHPIAIYALAEAYSLTKVPMLKNAVELGLKPIILGQHPSGSWDYNLRQTERDDTSYAGWCAQALKAAKMADDLDVPGLDEAYKLSNAGFRINAHPNGGFGYTSPGRGGLTSVGALCMMLMGEGNSPEVQKSLDLMDTWKLSWEEGLPKSSPQYYFYYATQCMFHAGGKRWDRWNQIMIPEYVKAQKVLSKTESKYVDHEGEPQEIGWWENNDRQSDRPVMDTCLATLQLEVYYRHLPTYRTPKIEDREVVLSSEDDVKVDIQF